MKQKLLRSGLIACVTALLLFQSSCHRQSGIRIGFVVTTLSNPYFVTMVNAAKAEAAATPGVQLLVQAPDQAVQVGQQIDDIDNLIAQHVNAICIVPADSKGVLPAIAKANQAGIPVLILDNKIDKAQAASQGVQTVTYIGSDNFIGGKMAGEYMIKKLPSGGDVAILEGVSGVDAANQRKAGFLAALTSAPARIKRSAISRSSWRTAHAIAVVPSGSGAFTSVFCWSSVNAVALSPALTASTSLGAPNAVAAMTKNAAVSRIRDSPAHPCCPQGSPSGCRTSTASSAADSPSEYGPHT